MWRMSGFRGQLTDNVPGIVIELALQKCGFKINMIEGSVHISSELTSHSETRSRGCRRVGLLLILLPVLEALQDPSSLALVKGSILFTLDGEYPSSLDKILTIDLSQIDKLEDIIVNPTP